MKRSIEGSKKLLLRRTENPAGLWSEARVGETYPRKYPSIYLCIRQRFGGQRSFVGLFFVGPESALQVIRHRRGIIQRAGVKPHSICAGRPRFVYCASKQVLSQPPTDEFREQAEVGNFRGAVVGMVQLKITGRRTL